MNIFKLLVLVAMCAPLYAAEEGQSKKQSERVIQVGPNRIYIVEPEAEFLYDLYDKAQSAAGSDKAKGNPEFIKSVLNNEQDKSLDECVTLLKKNQEYTKVLLKSIDQIYYSSRNLSEGLIFGALTLGGLAVSLMGAKWMNDLNAMYTKESKADAYLHAGLLEKIRSLRSGFVTKEEEKEIEAGYEAVGMKPPVHATYKDLLFDVMDKHGLTYSLALEQTNKAFQEAGIELEPDASASEKAKNLPYAVMAMGGGAVTYGYGVFGLSNYIGNVYKAYQSNKKSRDKVLKEMAQGENMLKILQAVEMK